MNGTVTAISSADGSYSRRKRSITYRGVGLLCRSLEGKKTLCISGTRIKQINKNRFKRSKEIVSLKILTGSFPRKRQGGRCLEQSYLIQSHGNGQRRMKLTSLDVAVCSWSCRDPINNIPLLPS